MAIDKKAIAEHIKGIIAALGDDPEREGLLETPDRVAGMYEEVFEGMNYSNKEIAEKIRKTFDAPCSRDQDNLIVVKDIEVFSYCEHHLALMYNMKVTVAYIPAGKVLGLSKIARISEMAAKRLQLQERLGSDISEIISMATGSEDVAVIIEACHSCMTARGIKNTSAATTTTTFSGRFRSDQSLVSRLALQL